MARRYQEIGLELWSELGEGGRSGYAHGLVVLSLVYPNTEVEKRMALMEEALAIFTGLRNEWGQAWTRFHWGITLFEQRENEQADAMYRQALAMFEQIGDQKCQGLVHNNLGGYYLNCGRYPEAMTHFQESSRLLEEIHFLHGLGIAFRNQGDILLAQGQLHPAEEMYRKSQPIHEQTGFLSEQAYVCYRIGQIRIAEQSYSAARESFLAALRVLERELGPSYQEDLLTQYTLAGLAAVVAAEAPEYSARLHGRVLAEIQKNAYRVDPLDFMYIEDVLRAVEAAIGAERYQALQREGAAQSLDQLLAGLPPSPPPG